MADETCWTLIEGAARGDEAARRHFTRRYLPIVRAYLLARWGGTELAAETDDAVQEVFLDLFREGGVLDRVDPARAGGFRAFLFGVLRTAALRTEKRRARQAARRADGSFHESRHPLDEEGLSTLFDREWAKAVMREAAELQERRAREKDDDAPRRVELLRLRFREGLPIREIAQLWGADPVRLHRDYARARREFKAALREVIAEHAPKTSEDVDHECERLLDLLG